MKTHPLDTVIESCLVLGISFRQMKEGLNMDDEQLREFLAERVEIDDDISEGLELLLGVDKQFWLNRQNSYWEACKIEDKWKLVGHSYQIADTGDYDGHWEITDGKVSLLSKDDDEANLASIVDELNRSAANLYVDDRGAEAESAWAAVSRLQKELEETKTALVNAEHDAMEFELKFAELENKTK